MNQKEKKNVMPTEMNLKCKRHFKFIVVNSFNFTTLDFTVMSCLTSSVAALLPKHISELRYQSARLGFSCVTTQVLVYAVV